MSAPKIDTCWSRIGTAGDRSCPELAAHVHCRNCPVYSAGAARLLDVEVSADYLEEQARRYAQRKETVRPGANSVVIFRLASEWLALPTALFNEVAPLRRLHSLPHRRERVVTGVANIRGELLVSVSLAAALGLPAEPPAVATARLAVIGRERERFVFAADEIAALHRYDDAELGPVPATLAHAQATHTRGMLAWRQRSVGVLDEARVLRTLNQRLG